MLVQDTFNSNSDILNWTEKSALMYGYIYRKVTYLKSVGVTTCFTLLNKNGRMPYNEVTYEKKKEACNCTF